jgi:hypothetical protein
MEETKKENVLNNILKDINSAIGLTIKFNCHSKPNYWHIGYITNYAWDKEKEEVYELHMELITKQGSEVVNVELMGEVDIDDIYEVDIADYNGIQELNTLVEQKRLEDRYKTQFKALRTILFNSLI